MPQFDYESLVYDLPDYPEPGVVFKDITPLLGSADGFAAMIDEIVERYRDKGITKVVCPEARGFMVGAPVAYALHAGFVPCRKAGKLPRETRREEYVLEYGTDALEIHADALTADDVVLIVDDLVASGGTVVAMMKLIDQFGAKIAGMGFLMELVFLDPRTKIAEFEDVDVFSLVKVN